MFSRGSSEIDSRTCFIFYLHYSPLQRLRTCFASENVSENSPLQSLLVFQSLRTKMHSYLFLEVQKRKQNPFYSSMKEPLDMHEQSCPAPGNRVHNNLIVFIRKSKLKHFLSIHQHQENKSSINLLHKQAQSYCSILPIPESFL